MLIRINESEKFVLPAPESASTANQVSPISLGDAVDAILSLTMQFTSFHDAASRLAAAFPVMRGAAAFSSQTPVRRERQAVVIAGPGASSQLTAADRARSDIVALHGEHRVLGHLPAHGSSICERAGRDQGKQSNESHNYVEHFEISEPMVGVNTV